MVNTRMDFAPTFPGLCERFAEIIDIMVEAATGLPRIENLLFQPVDQDMSPLSGVKIGEEIVDVTKSRINKVIESNRLGPQK